MKLVKYKTDLNENKLAEVLAGIPASALWLTA